MITQRDLSGATRALALLALLTLLALACAAAPARADNMRPASFGPDAAQLTNPYASVRAVGDFLMLKGSGSYQKYFTYETARGLGNVDGVPCLEVERFLINNENTDFSARIFGRCVAQDEQGALWVLSENGVEFGRKDARPLMPAKPKAGMVLYDDNDNILRLDAVDTAIELADGRRFENCLRFTQETPDDDLISHYAPGIGLIRSADTHDNTFELQFVQKKN